MPHRGLVSKEFAALLSVLSHPGRLQIVEELRNGERDVATLQSALGLSQPHTSQLLGVLKAHRLVAERKEGRKVLYHLTQPELAAWLVAGLAFVAGAGIPSEELLAAIEAVRQLWSDSQN
ncbi:MAG: metalloregulator ArsR/SmtB family transcription factor [Candidatus Sericytochromatia bacterium]|nr:metalloregulator ArsR/SmtB family transcription factor [Candidatus Sericytochromatia bacterium]